MQQQRKSISADGLLEFLRGNAPRTVWWIQLVLLLWVLLQTLIGFGGFLAYGRPMVAVSGSLLVLSMVHAVLTVLRKDQPSFHWILLVPIPWLFYCWLQYQFLSPFTWHAGTLFSVYLQGYALLIIVYNSISGVKSAKGMLLFLQLPILLAVLTAFLGFYLFPEWIQDGSRLPDPVYSHGMGGFFQDSSSLGALIVMSLPLMLVGIYKYRFNGPAMLYYCLVSGLFGIGLLMSSTRQGVLTFIFLLAITPFLISARWHNRKKFYQWTLIVLPVTLFILWFGTEQVNERLIYLLSNQSDPVATVSRKVGLEAFAGKPVTGIGMGGYSEIYSSYDTYPGGSASFHADGSYHEMLAETGIIGTSLFILMTVVIGIWVLFKWRDIQFIRLNEEVAHRLKTFTKHHPIHRKLRSEKGRMPFRKAANSGLMAGILGLLLYAGFDFSLKLPVVLFYLSCLTGVMLALCRGYGTRGNRTMAISAAILTVVLTTTAVIIGVPRHYSNYLTYTSSEDLTRLLDEPEQVFQSQNDLSYVESRLQLAVQLLPGNATAWSRLGTAKMLYLAAELKAPREVADNAMPTIIKALELNPDDWESNFNGAVVSALTSDNADLAIGHLRQAIAFAPMRPESHTLLGGLLMMNPASAKEGREMLANVVRVHPDYVLASSLWRRLGTRESMGNESVETRASLASQFRVLPQPGERVNGAGLPRPE